MNQTNVNAPRGNLQRDVQTRSRLATLTCPNCLGTLQIQADKSAEAPCPICRHPLKYVAPAQVPAKTFVARQRIPAAPAREAPQPAPQAPQQRPPQHPRPAPTPQAPPPRTVALQVSPAPQESPTLGFRFLSRLKRLDDFLNTPTGISIAWAFLAALLIACVVLFFHWDQNRRERTLRMESIESTRPAATHRPSTSSVPLLPGEPAPANTFELED